MLKKENIHILNAKDHTLLIAFKLKINIYICLYIFLYIPYAFSVFFAFSNFLKARNFAFIIK